MTQSLVMAFYGEGRADERFLPVLLQREAEDILLNYGRVSVDVIEPFLLRPSESFSSHAERLKRLAQDAAGYHVLVVHGDADSPSADRAMHERFQPGLGLISAARQAGTRVCGHVIPMIPIRMTEAWMLADAEAFYKTIGTRLLPEQLGLPSRPQHVESISEPKQTLLQAISIALADRPRRRRDPQQELVNLQDMLARQIRLDMLRRVPAFQRFEEDLHAALRALQLVD